MVGNSDELSGSVIVDFGEVVKISFVLVFEFVVFKLYKIGEERVDLDLVF